MFSHHDLASLNDLEMQVYHDIIKHPESVSYMTIRELAERAGVSTTTVLRFCRKMQCDGWSEFRICFLLAQQQTQPVQTNTGVSEMLSFFKSIHNDEFSALIARAAEMINQAEQIFFIGAGTSGSLAKYGPRFFSNVGNFSDYIDDPYYPVSGNMDNNTLAILLSVYGETPEILRLASQFSLHRCQTLAITHSENSSLAKMSDFTLAYHVPIISLNDNYDITTQVPVMYILEAIGRLLIK